MDKAFFIIALVGAFTAVFRSLGWGFVAVSAVGYFSGVIRANYLGMFSAFMFDAALAGLYLGFLFRKSQFPEAVRSGIGLWLVSFLAVWPLVLWLLPINHILIRCVGLRAAVWFLPVLFIATRLNTDDLSLLTRGFVVLNLAALAVGVYLYLYGVEALYPKNAVTEIIYKSKDVGAKMAFHRVPSSFLSAHSYGGTMLMTLPFLLDRIAGVKVRLTDRWLAIAGAVAAVGGLLMCGARSPLVVVTVALAIAMLVSGFSLKLGIVAAALIGGGLMVAGNDERLQRGSSLTDMSTLSGRVAISANESFLELLIKYPLGAGLGSAAGTNIPFFLADLAPESVGIENEYGRILVEQGWFGLGGWVLFLVWMFVRPPRARPAAPWRLGTVFMYSLTLSFWMTALIGTGILTAVPGTFLLLTQMGIVVVARYRGAVPEAVTSRANELARFEFYEDSDEVLVDDLCDVPDLLLTDKQAGTELMATASA